MTTTTDRLLQLAAEHEQKAQALRLAAHELNGHRTEKKRETLPTQLEAAITLRETQRPKKKPKTSAKRPRPAKGALLGMVLGFLGGGVRSKEEVEAFLKQHRTPLQGLGALFRYGHITLTKRGIVATAKGTKAASNGATRSAAAKTPIWQRAHAVLQAQGPMKWNQLRKALGLSPNTHVAGVMYAHTEALANEKGVWSAKEIG
jgi:anti-sigma factor RsiW